MQVTAKLQAGVFFQITTGSGYTLPTDGPPEHGGAGKGARPMELMLAAVASCSAVDVVAILRKGKHPFDRVEVSVAGVRAATVPAVFTNITLAFIITAVDDRYARRAVKLSVEKYCSALKMLANVATINWTLETEDSAT